MMDENTLYDLLTKALYHEGEKLVLYFPGVRMVFENNTYVVSINRKGKIHSPQDIPIGKHQNFIKLFKICRCFKHGTKYYAYSEEESGWVESDKYGMIDESFS